MTCRLTEIVVDCHDPAALAAFWAAVLHYYVVRTDDDQIEIAPWPEEPSDLARQAQQGPIIPSLVFVRVPEGKEAKNRLHLDIRPADSSYETEKDRLIGMGAQPRDLGGDPVPWLVLADPEGNEFCLLGALDSSG